MGSVGRGGWGIPSQGEGEERGLPSPCLGLGKDRTNDNVRGRCRWHAEALLSLKRGLYRILFARLKKIILLRERHRERICIDYTFSSSRFWTPLFLPLLPQGKQTHEVAPVVDPWAK